MAGLFWEVLAQQAIGVFICSSLPKNARVTEVDINVSRNRELLVRD